MVKDEIKEGKDGEIKQIQIELLEIKELKEDLLRTNVDLKKEIQESE